MHDANLSTAWPRGPLFGLLFDGLVVSLAELTRELSRLRSVIHSSVIHSEVNDSDANDGDAISPEQGSGDGLADGDDSELLRRTRETGWVLGVLAAAGGTDILRDRRERAGVRILVEFVEAVLSRRGHRLPAPSRALAEVRGGPNDWEIPWAVANALFLLGEQQPASGGSWSFLAVDTGFELSVTGSPGPQLQHFAGELALALPGSALRSGSDRWSLYLIPRV